MKRPTARRCVPVLGITLLANAASVVARANDEAIRRIDGPSSTLTNSIGMQFILIPRGRGVIGYDPGEDASLTAPSQRREIEMAEDYFIGAFEVTQRQYQIVMNDSPSQFAISGKRSVAVTDLNTDEFPVDSVSWDRATTFCERLSRLRAERRAKRAYRLPTEEEWEYACRATTKTAYHFGSKCNGTWANIDGRDPYGTKSRGSYLGRTARVGSYPPNMWGLYDMTGNVREWCMDADERDSGRHMVRGGSWSSPCLAGIAAYRDSDERDSERAHTGFRIVLYRAQRVAPK